MPRRRRSTGKAGRESERGVRFLDQDAGIAALAVRQHGVFALHQLAVLGLEARAVQMRAAAARLHRIYHGVYSLVPANLLSRDGRYMAAVLACGPGAVLSHRSAAHLLELRATSRAKIDVTVPRRSSRRHPNIDVHRSTLLRPRDVTKVNEVPCTTVSRTLLDLGDVVNRRSLERAFDQAEILGQLDLNRLTDQLEHNWMRSAARRVRIVLDTHYVGRTATWSEVEERFLALVRAAGLPDPEVNAWVVLPDGEPAIRVDFLWREQRVVVETDGWRTHRTRQSFERDRRNDQRLTAAQHRPLRATWRQITDDPARLQLAVLALFDRQLHATEPGSPAAGGGRVPR